MPVRFLVVLIVVFMEVMASSVAHAGAGDIARRAAACAQRHANLYDKHSREDGAAEKQLDRIGNTNYPALCEFGRKVGTPLLERQLSEVKALQGDMCWDSIDENVLSASEKNLVNYKKNVESDCKKAEVQPTPMQGGDVSCVVSTKDYENGARRSDNIKEFEKLECVKVANKCGFRIEFSVTVTGSYKLHKLADSVDPGKVGKICGSNERQSLSYSGWRRWGTTEPLRQ